MSVQEPVTRQEWDDLKANLNSFFLVIISMLIFFMQAGFAFLEVGTVRAKNTTNILMKNIMDSAIGSIVYWVCGYAFAFGNDNNFFIGYSNFLLIDLLETSQYSFYFFHFVFAATAATIVSGAMAERTKFVAYFIYSMVITGFVYPVVSHWAWSDKGWLNAECWWSDISYVDFAGSGVVHMLGGCAGLVGTVALGPRLDTFAEGKRQRLKGHTVAMSSLGAFILFFGFFAFNGGSQASIVNPGDGEIVAKILVNTILSGSFAGITVVVIYFLVNRKFSLLGCINGMLTGMVAICAGCDVLNTWGAAVTGVIAGITFVAYSHLVFKVGVDDPLDAFAVHYGGGFWGIIAVCLMADDVGILYQWDETSFKQLLWNLIGGLAITAWTVVLTAPLFFGLKFTGLLRVSENTEKTGLDVKEHGEAAYPGLAYVGSDLFRGFRLRGNSVHYPEPEKNGDLPVNYSMDTLSDANSSVPPAQRDQIPVDVAQVQPSRDYNKDVENPAYYKKYDERYL